MTFEHYCIDSNRKDLEVLGRNWLNQLNSDYIKIHEKLYLAKDEKFEKFVDHFNPIINEALEYYLKYIPEDLKMDICREIKEKIIEDVMQFSGTAPQFDDITIVVVKVL